MPPRNHLTEWGRYDASVEVYHLNNAGDLIELQFELPQGLRRDIVERAMRQFGQLWIERKAREGLQVVNGTVQCNGPFPTLELDKLDLDTYTITARFKRMKPLVVSKEKYVEEYAGVAPVRGSAADIYSQAMRLPHLIEGNARATAAAHKRVDVVRRQWKDDEEYRRSRGLPLFDPEQAAKELGL